MDNMARNIAEYLHDMVNKHRELKGLPVIQFSEALYERGLIICKTACRIYLQDREQLVKYGFRQLVSRILIDPYDQENSIPDQILDAWTSQEMTGWNIYTKHSYSAVAVSIHGHNIFISYSQADQITHPAMRTVTPASILRLPPMAVDEQSSHQLDQSQLEVITNSIHKQLNVSLFPREQFLQYSEELNRVARYYCTEALDMGFSEIESSQMIVMVSLFEVNGNEPKNMLGRLIADTLLREMEVPGIQGDFYCGIAAVNGGNGTLCIGVVLL